MDGVSWLHLVFLQSFSIAEITSRGAEGMANIISSMKFIYHCLYFMTAPYLYTHNLRAMLIHIVIRKTAGLSPGSDALQFFQLLLYNLHLISTFSHPALIYRGPG